MAQLSDRARIEADAREAKALLEQARELAQNGDPGAAAQHCFRAAGLLVGVTLRGWRMRLRGERGAS